MRDLLKALALIALLLACCCGLLYSTGHGQVISDAASALNAFVNPSTQRSSFTQNISSCKGGYYVTLACQDAVEAGIPPDLFIRQIRQESGFNPSELSPQGDEGIAQFQPDTAAGLGINPWDPVAALKGAAQLMSRYYKNYGDYAMALAAYNGGSGRLSAAVKNCGSNWLSCEPPVTQAYVHIIMG
jgi:soluble lytic murein transglycosylase-like protein